MDPHLIIKFCKSECSSEECKFVEEQMASSKEVKSMVERYILIMNLYNDIDDMEAIDVEAAYDDVVHNINVKRKLSLRTKIMQIAAMLTLPLLLSSLILGYMVYNKTPSVATYTEIRANLGLIVKHTLPDQSTIWLNSGTVISYLEDFRKENRTVNLVTGEIFVDVIGDKANPFYVNTLDGMSVYVYGTKFNVRNYENNNFLETTLTEGKVNIILDDGKEQVVLSPGESAVFNKQTKEVSVREVNLSEKTAWRNGKLIFRNALLEDILKELSRHFDMKINYKNDKGIEYRYRATFTDESVSQIIDFLSQSASIEWEIVDDVTKIRVDGETPKMINLYIH